MSAAAASPGEPRIRAFRDEDLEAVLALRARVFGASDLGRERLRWIWEYDANPFREPGVPCAWVAEAGDELVGNYGMLPLAVAIDGVSRPALCGMDFCVAPELRNLGLGLRMTRAFLETPGCAFAFVTSPTPPATALMRYYGAAVLEGRREACLWVATGAAPVPPLPPAEGASLALEELADFDERCDALFARVARRHRLLTVRDRRYLRWRYRDYPFGGTRARGAVRADGSLAGLAVVQEDAALGRGYLCELLLDPGAERAAGALLVCDALSARAGAGELYAFHRDPAAHAVLARAGFQRVEDHPLTALARLPAGCELGDWYLSSGDGDFLFGVGG